MGSSSGPSARGTYNTHSSWYNGDGNEYGEVQIRSIRVKEALGLGVHHLVRFTMPSFQRGIGLFLNGVVMEVIFMLVITFLLIIA